MHQYAIDAIRSTDSAEAPLVFVPVESDGSPIEGADAVVGTMPDGNVVSVYHPQGKPASDAWFSQQIKRIGHFLAVNAYPKMDNNE